MARITGATLGVAVLGTIYTLAGGGADGLRLAMLTGGLLQITVAGIAWRTPRVEAPDGFV